MPIIMEKQFEKLKAALLNTKKIYWGDAEDEYSGPVNPTAIFIRHDESLRKLGRSPDVNYFLIAESVPPKYTYEGEMLSIVMVELDDDFEFKGWNAPAGILKGAMFEVSDDGTLEFLSSQLWCQGEVFYKILYKKN